MHSKKSATASSLKTKGYNLRSHLAISLKKMIIFETSCLSDDFTSIIKSFNFVWISSEEILSIKSIKSALENVWPEGKRTMSSQQWFLRFFRQWIMSFNQKIRRLLSVGLGIQCWSGVTSYLDAKPRFFPPLKIAVYFQPYYYEIILNCWL